MYRAWLGLKARAWAQLEQAWVSKCREPSLGRRLRLGLARLSSAQLRPKPGLEEGKQET